MQENDRAGRGGGEYRIHDREYAGAVSGSRVLRPVRGRRRNGCRCCEHLLAPDSGRRVCAGRHFRARHLDGTLRLEYLAFHVPIRLRHG